MPLAAKEENDMNDEAAAIYLIRRGWERNTAAHVYQWRHPIDRLSWYNLRDAVTLEQRRQEFIANHTGVDMIPTGTMRTIVVELILNDEEQDIHPQILLDAILPDDIGFMILADSAGIDDSIPDGLTNVEDHD